MTTRMCAFVEIQYLRKKENIHVELERKSIIDTLVNEA